MSPGEGDVRRHTPDRSIWTKGSCADGLSGGGRILWAAGRRVPEPEMPAAPGRLLRHVVSSAVSSQIPARGPERLTQPPPASSWSGVAESSVAPPGRCRFSSRKVTTF